MHCEWQPPPRIATRIEDFGFQVRPPDRDFIPLSELEAVCGVNHSHCQELLLSKIRYRGVDYCGVFIHAETVNCPPNCFRVTESENFRFVPPDALLMI